MIEVIWESTWPIDKIEYVGAEDEIRTREPQGQRFSRPSP